MNTAIPRRRPTGLREMTPEDAGFAPVLSVILPIELTNNNTGRGHKFWKSAAERQRIVRRLSIPDMRRAPFPFPIRVDVTRILGPGQRLWDYSSILRGNYKELEDSLTSLGWWIDDGPNYITHVVGYQDATRRDAGPATQLDIYRS